MRLLTNLVFRPIDRISSWEVVGDGNTNDDNDEYDACDEWWCDGGTISKKNCSFFLQIGLEPGETQKVDLH